MPLEVGQADEHIGVHDGPADLGALDILAALHRDLHIVGALEAVGDDHRAAGGQRGEAVLPGTVEVLDGVFAAAGVEGVAVGEEGDAAELLDEVGHRLGVVRAQVGDVAQLAEVHLDGDELAAHIDLPDARRLEEALELVGQPLPETGAEAGEVDFGSFHENVPFITH